MRKWYKEIKRRWLLYWLRETLRTYKVNESKHSDETLILWVKENGGMIGIDTAHKPEHFHQNYIKVEPADKESGKPEAEKLADMAKHYELEIVDIYTIHSKCGSDVKKTSYVLQMMEITYQNDDNVLIQYDSLYQQLKNRLK